MIKRWFIDTGHWFRTLWLNWIVLIAYVSGLYLINSLNLQVLAFGLYLVLFSILTIGLIIGFKYLRKTSE